MSRFNELIAGSQAGETAADEELLTENAGLIWSVVKRFSGRGVEMDDLYQLGCMGFLKAVRGFDFDYGTQFSTYAVPKIAGEIRRFLRDDGAVKVSRGLKERASAVKICRNDLLLKLGREPTIQEIAECMGISAEDIAEAEIATATVESIQQQTGEDGFSLEHILTDSDTEDALLEKMALRQAIEKLSDKEATVINLRYFHSLTQERISKILHVSQVQISRIEKKAISKLRELLK